MLKFIIAFERNPRLSRKETHAYLSDIHGPLVKSVPEFCRHVRGYVQNFVFDAGVAPAEFSIDGAAELWFDNAETFVEAYAEPRYLELVRPDEPRFANPDRMVAAFTTESVVLDRNSGGAVKLMRFLAAAPGADAIDFAHQWQVHYGDVIRSNEDLSGKPVKYVQNWSTSRASNPFPLARDYVGVDEIWFDTVDDLHAFLDVERSLITALAGAGVLDASASVSFAVSEKRVLP
jgi:uncharacterized protein (TIGR02118 family)